MTVSTFDTEGREANLRDRVREVYIVFRGYRLAVQIEPDPCFPSVCDSNPLRADSLQRLPASAFDVYQHKAITTWGTVDDFKYFLPRLLELVAIGQAQHGPMEVEAELIFGKLSTGAWQNWKPREQQVLDTYFESLWSALLARQVETSEAAWPYGTLGDWLRAFAHAHDDLSRFLRQWEEEGGDAGEKPTAAAHLAQTILNERDQLFKHGTLNWDVYRRLEAQEAQMMAWLASDAVFQMLESAFFRWADSSYAVVLSEGYESLCLWRQRLRTGK